MNVFLYEITDEAQKGVIFPYFLAFIMLLPVFFDLAASSYSLNSLYQCDIIILQIYSYFDRI